MSRPVRNWGYKVGDTPVFLDIAGQDLVHYGPRAAWRALSRNDIGGRKAILQGTIDLGYDSGEVAALKNAVTGKRLAPISIKDVHQEIRPNFAIDPPHVFKLSVVNHLPFPAILFSVTVDLAGGGGSGLADRIEAAWSAKSLFSGSVVFAFDAVTAFGGYIADVDYRAFVRHVAQNDGTKLSTSNAWKAAQSAVLRNESDWLTFYGMQEEAAERAKARETLTEILFSGGFVDDGVLVRYDSGAAARLWKLRDPITLVGGETRVFVRSTPEQGTLGVEFG